MEFCTTRQPCERLRSCRNLLGDPGVVLAETLAGVIMAGIETLVTPLTGDVRVFDQESDISSIRSLGTSVEDVTDLVLSIKIYHS
ncbi:hypothetical protein [Methanosarcina siciliae]|uniref:hypothetical protein n=1 Tax=Methanosarcina siciliae TaxID=38027 RepID=UPI00064FDF27|nr:hypothetical protein [Methanosarcina siciliae]